MSLKKFLPLAVLTMTGFAAATEPADIVVVVLSQVDGYHAAHANLLKRSIVQEAMVLEMDPPRFLLTHEIQRKTEARGWWTLYPLIPTLSSQYSSARWYVFCPESTMVRLEKLVSLLSRFNSSKSFLLGHAVYDREPTIIHHFADNGKKFKYPNIGSGVAISRALIETLNARLTQQGYPENDFAIDSAYEFASFVFNGGKGTRLTHVPEMCVVSTEDCATYPKFFHPCGDPVPMERIFVAVKTYSGNHRTRLPVVTKTWLRYAENFALFSNEPDAEFDVVIVPHTREGHCEKTYSILRHVENLMKTKKIDWLVITDDDTILSLSRLSRFLSCYNSQQPVAIGERYGFHVTEETGYEYLTGGAGVVLSAPLVHGITTSLACTCPLSTTPDDMFLFGICLSRLDVPPTHSPLFHQARPADYATAYLASQEPISFHKFWMIDPFEVYRHWFAETDGALRVARRHTEL